MSETASFIQINRLEIPAQAPIHGLTYHTPIRHLAQTTQLSLSPEISRTNILSFLTMCKMNERNTLLIAFFKYELRQQVPQ